MTWGVAAVAAAVAGLGLVACGDDSGSSSSVSTAPGGSAAPETSASSGSGGTLTVTASEPAEGKYAFDVPAEIKGGTIQVTLNNTGEEAHELGFVKVSDGTTAQQFADDVLTPEGAPIPDFVVGAPGGLGGIAPGASGTSTISLDAGTYVYFCTLAIRRTTGRHARRGDGEGRGEHRSPAADDGRGRCLRVQVRRHRPEGRRQHAHVREQGQPVPPPHRGAADAGRNARRREDVPALAIRSPTNARRSTSARSRTSRSPAPATRKSCP